LQKLSDVFARYPVWSPDGEWLCFFGAPDASFRTSENNLYHIRADGTDLALLISELNPLYPPIWSADGEWLVFIQTVQGTTFLSKIHVDGLGLETVATDLHRIGNVTQSPGGEWIAFSAWENLNYDLFLIHPDGSGLRRLTNTPHDHEYAPQWSPPVNLPWHRGSLIGLGLFLGCTGLLLRKVFNV
jgi:TolB protein